MQDSTASTASVVANEVATTIPETNLQTPKLLEIRGTLKIGQTTKEDKRVFTKVITPEGEKIAIVSKGYLDKEQTSWKLQLTGQQFDNLDVYELVV